ncbi:MAG: hypothetical protein SGBAC_012979 [Bacillariaceae sp.]
MIRIMKPTSKSSRAVLLSAHGITDISILQPQHLSFLADYTKSALLYGALLAIATMDKQVDLSDKFSIQATGISHLIDTYSDAFIVVEMPIALQYSYKGVLCFGVVATLFHALGIDESGTDPHPCFSCYFSMVGAFILYWHAKGTMDLSTHLVFQQTIKSEPSSKTLNHDDHDHEYISARAAAKTHQRLLTHFLGLALLPICLCMVGASSAVNRFLFNGYGFFYAAFAMEPVLKQAVEAATLPLLLPNHFINSRTQLLQWKLQLLRILFPSIGFSYVVESLIVEHLQIDPHAIVHVLAMTYVLVMHSILSELPTTSGKESGLST